MDPTSERAFAFVMAAIAPAVATVLYFLLWMPLGPGPWVMSARVTLAGFAFLAALVVTGIHAALLAAPLHALLSRRRTPGPVAILLSSMLVGAIPLPLLLQPGTFRPDPMLGLLGLIGGVAFLLADPLRRG